MLCLSCNTEKGSADFYASNKSHCKVCVRARVTEHRLNNIERVRAYDRERGKLPHRIKNATAVTLAWRQKHPGRQRAHNAIARAQLTPPERCEGCGHIRRLETHHHDYSKPLVVVWLCKPCHVIADKIRRRLEAV